MTFVRCGEQGRVALEVAGRRPRARRHAARSAAGRRRLTLPLSSIVTPLTVQHACISSSTSSRASASRGGRASARSCPRCSPARSRAGDLEIDFKRHGLLVPGGDVPFLLVLSCSAIVLLVAERRCAPERARARPGAVRAGASHRPGARRAAVRRHARRDDDASWPGLIGGVAVRRARRSRHRARCRARARAARQRRPRRRCRSTPRRAALVLAGAVGRCSAARARRARPPACGCWSPAARRDGPEVRRPAHPPVTATPWQPAARSSSSP